MVTLSEKKKCQYVLDLVWRGKCLILLIVLLSLSLDTVNSNLLVVLLKGSQILSGLGELSLLHTLTDVPVDKGSLRVHQVKLVVKSGPRLSNSSGVGQHADSPLD